MNFALVPLFALTLAACSDSSAPATTGTPPVGTTDGTSQNGMLPSAQTTGDSVTGTAPGAMEAAGQTPTQTPSVGTPNSPSSPSAPTSPGSPTSPTDTGGAQAASESTEEGMGAATETGNEPSPAPAAMKCGEPDPNPNAGNACLGTEPPALKLTEVASGLSLPTFVTHAPGDGSRLFVLEQGGTVRIIKDGSLLPTPFLDVSSKTRLEARAAGERGLLGLAFAPDYATSRRFWVHYTARSGATMIEGYVANEDGDTADPGSGKELFTTAQPFANHNGGMLAFGPDGCLYAGLGDGGLANDPQANGQNTSTPLAGMLRFDVDNPTAKTPGNVLDHPQLWSYGLRNPWRFSFDRETGDMYIGDVGQDTLEEVDVEPRGVAGRNYGWSCREGDGGGPAGCSGDFVAPVTAYPTSRQDQSVIGGYVYRGKAIPGMVGRYIYADYNSRKIRTFVWKGADEICDEYELTDQLQTQASISSFGEDADGELYIVELASSNGRVLRIVPQ